MLSLLCLDKITYYINGSLKICHRGDSLNFCDSFVLQFNQGVISSDYLAESKIEHLAWGTPLVEHTKEAMSVSDQITEDIENDKYEDEIVFMEPSGWLLSHDILETIGYSIGFLGILALILYLKCRNKNTSTTLVPWFDNIQRNVQMVGIEPKFESLHQPVGYVATAQP